MKDIIKKFNFKDIGVVLNAPPTIKTAFELLGFRTTLCKKTTSKNTLVFINNKSDFLEFFKNEMANIELNSVLWFAYPKGTSKIITDINRDILRITGEEFGITTVAAISINEIWSALRFRPIDKVGKK